jgi:hypothetical protein
LKWNVLSGGRRLVFAQLAKPAMFNIRIFGRGLGGGGTSLVMGGGSTVYVKLKLVIFRLTTSRQATAFGTA